MSSDMNKPTGYGYQGSPYRECAICSHVEGFHYGHQCLVQFNPNLDEGPTSPCACPGFSTRVPSLREQEILDEQVHQELEFVGEALTRELKAEVKRRG